LRQGELEASPRQIHLGKQAIAAGRRRVQRQRFLRERFGSAKIVGDKIRPSRRHRFDQR
jgi:hypothetical protein